MQHETQVEHGAWGRALVAACGAEQGREAELGRLAIEVVGRGRTAWPGLDLASVAFVRHLGSLCRGAGEGALDAAAAHAADLWLAFACAQQLGPALRALDPRIVSVCTRLVRQGGAGPLDASELAQAVREHVLMASKPGAQPRIARYGARAPLDAWLWTTARRLALTSARRRDLVELLTREILASVPAPGPEPEQSLERLETRRALKECIDRAFAGLELRQRNVLRLSLIDRLGPDELGAVFGVHRATAARQLALAKDTLRERIHAALATRLDLRADEARAWLARAHSLMDVSLERLLADV